MSANTDADESIKVEGFGLKGEAHGKKLLSENTLVLVFVCVLAYFVYTHHTTNEEALRKIFEATVENTYVLSLSQPDRERLNISMPESLRRKTRGRE